MTRLWLFNFVHRILRAGDECQKQFSAEEICAKKTKLVGTGTASNSY